MKPKTAIQSIATTDFRVFLVEELVRRSRNQTGYSLRAFARALETDPSSLAKLINGKNRIGAHSIRILGKRLALTAEKIEEFVQNRHALRNVRSTKIPTVLKTMNYQGIETDSFELISDWYNLAILELTHLEGFSPSTRWIAQALGITASEVRASVDRLQRLGLLEISADKKRWIDRSGGFTTNITARNRAVAQRRFQEQVLRKAIHALENTPVAARDQTTMTFAIDPDRLPEIRERIKNFRRELDQFISSDRKREVYHFSISLYPVSRSEFLNNSRSTNLEENGEKQ